MKRWLWSSFLAGSACYAAAAHEGGATVILAVLALACAMPGGEETHDSQFRIVPHVAGHARRFSAASFFWTLAAWRSLREGSLTPLLHHAEWRAAWRVARSLAIVVALLPIGAHAESSVVQFHGGVATPAQEFKSPEWRDTIRAGQEEQWRATLAYCRENPDACTYHNVPLKDR